MKLSSKAALGRLGPIRVTNPRSSSSSAIAKLTLPSDGTAVDTAAAIVVLHVKTSLTLLQAKRLVEKLVSKSELLITLPDVQDVEDLTRNLVRAGVMAAIRSENLVRPEVAVLAQAFYD